jgi:hypothetical protein
MCVMAVFAWSNSTIVATLAQVAKGIVAKNSSSAAMTIALHRVPAGITPVTAVDWTGKDS